MKLTLQDVTQKKNEFEKACITLPSYDIEAVHKKTLEEPVWVHFGAGNIFRGYIAGLQEDLLNKVLLTEELLQQRLLIMISSIRSTSHMSQ